MSTSCPACAKAELRPVTLDDGLPAQACPDCQGTLLSLTDYRSWREHHAAPVRAVEGNDAASVVADSTLLLRCPHCKGFMTKFRFSADARNQLDLCDDCDAVWLDRGEWKLVEHLARNGQLAKVFDAPWQKRLRDEQVRRRAEERWRSQLGEDYEKALELRNWLTVHPKGKELLAYLYLSQTEGV